MLVVLLVVTAVAFGLYNVFIKMSSAHIDPVLGAVLLQFVAAFLGLALLLYLRAGAGEPLLVTGRGAVLAVLAGVAIGFVEILTFFIFGRGIPVAVGNPLIVGGSLIVTTGVGVALLRERITSLQALAIVLLIVGVLLLALGARKA
jgi:transporter family protein